jgi:hypothetical protein
MAVRAAQPGAPLNLLLVEWVFLILTTDDLHSADRLSILREQ